MEKKTYHFYLVVSTHLQKNSQLGNLPQIGGENLKKIFETTTQN